MAKRETFVGPEFASLFSQYAGGNPESLGMAYRNAFAATQNSDPLLVCTARYLVLYPGNGNEPSYFAFRLGMKGFVELTAISHLGPAMATLAQLNMLGEEWQSHAKNHMNATHSVRAANSEAFWRDEINVESYRGREASIAAMVDYACDMTIHFLRTVLADPSKLTPEYVREHYLQGQTPVVNPTMTRDANVGSCSNSQETLPLFVSKIGSSWNGSISFNEIMVATFYLGSLDLTYRMQKWLRMHDVNWKSLQVLINGGAGRPTAGVTISSNSLAMVILRSVPDLPIEHMYIAPHGSAPNIRPDATPAILGEHETEFRTLWGMTRGWSHLGSEMFTGFPKYKPTKDMLRVIDETTTELDEPPIIRAHDDWYSLITRLRFTLEDPRQTLSAAVADFAAQELAKSGFDLEKIAVSGLDGYDYIFGRRPGTF